VAKRRRGVDRIRAPEHCAASNGSGLRGGLDVQGMDHQPRHPQETHARFTSDRCVLRPTADRCDDLDERKSRLMDHPIRVENRAQEPDALAIGDVVKESSGNQDRCVDRDQLAAIFEEDLPSGARIDRGLSDIRAERFPGSKPGICDSRRVSF
jgi:hypothetical protein